MRSPIPALFLASAVLAAQSNVGSITGIVSDKSGGVVPGARIAITNQDTRLALETVSNESGVYTAPSLIAGRYRVAVEAAGFKTRQVPDFTLESGQKMRMDFTLEVGDVKDVVEVQAAAVLLQQESAEISDTISASEIRNLPLSTRTPYALLGLSAGIVAGGNDPADPDFAGASSINGARARGTAFVVDGASTTHIGGIAERIGSIEAIHEFRVMSSTYSAEYGHTTGAVVSFQVKAGTSDYHGSLYEYHRNRAMNAANWELNARGLKPAALIRNEFGATIGGPVPGMQNRMFFFGSYEGLRDRIPGSRTRTIPEAGLRGGDFSGVPVVVNDPLTSAPFPRNVIPSSRLDPAGVKFLQLFPQPNVEGVFNPRFGIRTVNWTRVGPTSDYKNFGVGRLDYSPGAKNKFFFTFSHVNEGPRDLGIEFDNVLNTVVGPRFRNIRRASFNYTRFFRPTLTNEFLAFAQRDPRKITPWFDNFDVTKELGIQKRIGTTLPSISIGGGYGSFGNSQVQDWVHQPSGLSDILTWQRGRHTLRMGGQLYQNQFWYISSPNLSGSYDFNGEITGLGVNGRNNPIYSLADLLLGAVKGAQIAIPQIPINRTNYNLGLFFNDDWKVTSRLTLNLGLRYEFETRQVVKNNVYSRVDITSGQLLVAGRNAARNLNLNNDYVNFSPRLGAAWSVNDKTVVRSGFGVFHANFWVDNGELVSYPGWTGTQVFVDQGLGRAQPFTFQQGFPVETVPAVTDPLALAAASNASRPLAVQAVSYDASDRLPYNLQWNLSVQRDLGSGTVVELAYVASRSVSLPRSYGANNARLERAPEVVIQRVPIQQVRPFPAFSGFNAVHYDVRTFYNSFQAKATKRFQSGLSYDINYTFSKNMESAGGSQQIPWQYSNIERAVADLDRPHVFTFGTVYQLPFGKGKKFFDGNRVASAVLGGWQVNSLFSAATGLPVTITHANTNLVLGSQRPDVIDPARLNGKADVQQLVGPARRWLTAPADPAFPFRLSSNLGFGNLGRNTTREPGFWNLNLGVFRDIPITERVRFQFRFEAYNALNHVNYLEPASFDITNANYGLITAAAPARQMQVGARLSF